MKKFSIFDRNVYILIINKINIVTQKLFKHLKDDKEGRMSDPIKDRTINNLLLLYVIHKTNEIGKLENNLKLQKLVFLIQKNLLQRKLKGFSYNFFRWKQGPFSAGVNDDLKLLKNRYIKWKDGEIYLTKDGEKLLSDCKILFEKNDKFANSFNSIIDEYASFSPEELKNDVYKQSMFVPGIRKVMPIEKIPMRLIMLFKPQEQKMKGFFEMDVEWETTLELLFDEGALASLKNAYDDAKEGRHGEPIRVHTA